MRIKDILYLLEYEEIKVIRQDTSELICKGWLGKKGISHNENFYKKLLQYQDHKLFGISSDNEDKTIILWITNEIEVKNEYR